MRADRAASRGERQRWKCHFMPAAHGLLDEQVRLLKGLARHVGVRPRPRVGGKGLEKVVREVFREQAGLHVAAAELLGDGRGFVQDIAVLQAHQRFGARHHGAMGYFHGPVVIAAFQGQLSLEILALALGDFEFEE